MEFPTKMLDAIRAAAHAMAGAVTDHDALLEAIGDCRFVLIGEASHGTHEFYYERAEITKRLILERGFNAVAVEADWPDAYRVNEWVRGLGEDQDAVDALSDFKRFPAWMWRNADVLDFIGWLRDYNDGRETDAKVGFYGLDLYALHASINAVLEYLQKVDPAEAKRARERYSCFDHVGADPQFYGFATSIGAVSSCENEVVQELVALRNRAERYRRMDGRMAEDEFFFAEQNARLAVNAEKYYRSMYRGRESTWNLRDLHMADTLDALVEHLANRIMTPKIVVWAHNSHLGDARATESAERGEWNLGQLVRERWGDTAFLVGFSTYSGTVTAASDWDGPAERKRVRPGLPGSYEALFHATEDPAFTLILRDDPRRAQVLQGPMLQRAIGVIYRPETERISHYFHTRLPEQFDAMLHIDHTRAVEPLERGSLWTPDEAPHTFPSAL